MGGSLDLGEGGAGSTALVGGEEEVGGESIDFSLNIDFSFLILCVGARPVSVVKLKLIKLNSNSIHRTYKF